MKDFFKKNWFGVVTSVGVGVITWLTYLGGKCDGKIEAYGDIADILQDAIEETTEKITE